MTIPELPSKVRKRGKCVAPVGGQVSHFTIVGEVRTFQDKAKTKIIALQLLEFDDGRKEVRLGYYIIGKKPKMLGRWVWGQYAAMMPPHAFVSVVRKAVKLGWFSL